MAVSPLQVALAGLLGAIAMALATSLFHFRRVAMVDFGRLIATKLLRYHSHGTQLGLALHLVNGIVLAFIYALIVQPFLPGPALAKGALYGVALWLIMMLGVLPALGDGFFGWRSDRSAAPSGLALHLLYGLILGAVFAA
ncbi:MAG TPA: DUF6789 family protein [Chloroflexota bacterium]|jgi:uncharacterized membrane protein YagU involved in acid resistance